MSNKFMSTFTLQRSKDVSGISGVGLIATGCIFKDTNEVVVHWLGTHSCTNIYHSLDDVIFIHGHENATKICFDEEEKDLNGDQK